MSHPSADVRPQIDGPESPHFKQPDADVEVQAWEEVAEGRYMPRRIRGSCQGRALG